MENDPSKESLGQELSDGEIKSWSRCGKVGRSGSFTCHGPKKLNFLRCPLAANFIKQKLLGMSGNEVLVKKLAKNLNRVRFEAGF